MKKSTRALVGLIVIDALLLGGAAWMVLQVKTGAWNAPDAGEAIQRITTIGGGAVGLVTVILALAFVVHRRKGN